MELATVSADAGHRTAPATTDEAALKELAGDESLSEEARDSAMKALEVLVASQLEEIERAAAAKKRTAALNELESEVQFAEAEQSVALKKLDGEAQFIDAEAAAKRKKATAEMLQKLDVGVESGVEEMVEWLKRHRLSRHAQAIVGVAGM